MNVVNHKWIRTNVNRNRLTICFLFSMLLSGGTSAQTAMELFNPAAKNYIYGDNAAASNLVMKALAKYPTDEKLVKLKELIDQQQDQQNQQQQNQDQQNQDQNEQQQNQDQQDQQNQDQQEEQQQEQEEQNTEGEDAQEAQPASAQPHQAGEMTEEEAQQLLDAMKQNEKDQRTDLRPILGRPVRVDKDW